LEFDTRKETGSSWRPVRRISASVCLVVEELQAELYRAPPPRVEAMIAFHFTCRSYFESRLSGVLREFNYLISL
jgi:hypothetical protein